MKFNEKLQELRMAQELSYKELGEYIYVEARAVRDWERGRGYPSLPLLIAISKFFGVTIDELLAGDMAELPISSVGVQNVFLDLRFGEKVYMMRKQLRLSRAEFCERVHVATSSLETWEKELTLPSVLTLMKVSKFFGVPIDEMIHVEINEN